MTRTHVLLIALAIFAAGCGLTSNVDEIPINEAGVDDATVATINALVPAGTMLEFEQRIADDAARLSVAVAPHRWLTSTEQGGTAYSTYPGSGVDPETTLTFRAVCVGLCDKEDWSDYMYNDGFSPFAVFPESTVLVDRELPPAGRTLVAEQASGVRNIVVSRWNDKATHFFLCQVTLQPADVVLEAAFLAACEATIPLWLGRESAPL